MRPIHLLKCWPFEFQSVVDFEKRFEFRKDDRDFASGDTIILQEWEPHTKKYTGRTFTVTIDFIMRKGFGLPDGYCIMSISPEFQVTFDETLISESTHQN